ncbi:DNA polymerase III, partial [candidate division WOR-3 bacterium]|nr:DNA polymerase III [candidate division WOR-3 bacterium]
SIRDVDLLAAAGDGPAVVAAFTGHPRVRQVLAAGTTKASARFETGDGLRQVDLRVIDDASWGAALQYFTGSKAHNVALRALARRKGLKLSERGVLRRGRRIAGRTEQEVYAALGLPWIDPELREDRGELAAAATGSLPGLVTLDDIRADLHMHTDRSDGTASFEEMARACAARGYSHIAVAEHSVSAGYADGLDIEALQRLCDHIDAFNGNAHSRRFRVLKSSEVDIRPDGSLDYPDRVLARLDLVIASIHQAFQRDATRRMCGAIEHPLVHLVAHPTGRIIGRRPGYDIDLDRVIDCAARHHKVLEINAYPGRLDLSDLWARKATQAGVKLAVNTDAHSAADLGWMRFGVTTARRAWAKPGDIVNCLTYRQLLKLLSEIRGN